VLEVHIHEKMQERRRRETSLPKYVKYLEIWTYALLTFRNHILPSELRLYTIMQF